MVIKFNNLQPSYWLPSTTDFTATLAGQGETAVNSNDIIVCGSHKFQNNTSAPSAKYTLNLNTMFSKSGKTKFLLNGTCYSWCKGYVNAGNGSSYIRLTDGTTTVNLIEASISVNGSTYYRSNYATASYTIEKVSSNQLTITKINGDTVDDGSGYSGTASIANTSTTTFNTFSSLSLEIYSAVGGSYTSNNAAAYYRATCSYPKFVSRFL